MYIRIALLSVMSVIGCGQPAPPPINFQQQKAVAEKATAEKPAAEKPAEVDASTELFNSGTPVEIRLLNIPRREHGYYNLQTCIINSEKVWRLLEDLSNCTGRMECKWRILWRNQSG